MLRVTGTAFCIYARDTSVERFQIASPSEGICANAALAIVAARELGIADAAIRERIAAWVPSSNRGRIASQGAQTFYIDCYNANPASMGDALSAFCRATPSEQARCYVLGAMNELGADTVALHREVGQQLELRPEDQAFFVGPDELTLAYRMVRLRRAQTLHSSVASRMSKK